MNENFLLNTEISKKLFASVSNLPIIDFHNHLNVSDLQGDRRFSDITELWIAPDPYKHRAMRILGVDEFYITGAADNYKKFLKWMESLPMLVGHPLYIWSQLELKRVFDIDVPLNPDSAEFIWNRTKELLEKSDCSNNRILDKFGIAYSAPCCAIADDVSFFVGKDNLAPSLRGDDMVAPTATHVANLEKATGMEIKTLSQYLEAIKERLDAFDKAGCRFADHALDDGFSYVTDDGNNEMRFLDAIAGREYNEVQLRSCILYSSQVSTIRENGRCSYI